MKSIQLTILERLWAEWGKDIKWAMIKQANDFCVKKLHTRMPDDWPPTDYCNLFGDGAFDPFRDYPSALSALYNYCMELLGNEDDEVEYLNRLWVETLTKRAPKKYAIIIAEFERIRKEGL